MTTTVAEAERASRALLPRVSRTFALGIKLLPPHLEPPVRLGYLLCRIADTVEDDLALPAPRRAELLDAFLRCFESAEAADAFGAYASELTSSPDYLELVRTSGDVFLMYRKLNDASREILREWVEEMVHGMRRFVLEHPTGIRIANVDEFKEYCYYVAGTVGHLLTDLWHAHSVFVGPRHYARLLENCEPFGEALQTVNILKDVAWDVEQENQIYIPADLLAAAGTSHDAILADGNRAATRKAMAPLLALANDDVERALLYIEQLPLNAVRIRLFCVLPILLAIATLRELEQTDAMLVPGGGVKITRSEVKALMIAASAAALTNPSLRWIARRTRQRPFSLALR
jgi:farnesyl-diphosphate farnesyltransferase